MQISLTNNFAVYSVAFFQIGVLKCVKKWLVILKNERWMFSFQVDILNGQLVIGREEKKRLEWMQCKEAFYEVAVLTLCSNKKVPCPEKLWFNNVHTDKSDKLALIISPFDKHDGLIWPTSIHEWITVTDSHVILI